jgi:putative hydrolase of the HAD superfamily
METTRPLETVFLDAGGVLIHPNWERVAAAAARAGITVGGAALRRAEARAKHGIDAPAHVASTDDVSRGRRMYALAFERAGSPLSSAQLDAVCAEIEAEHARRNLWDVVLDEAAPALRRLREAGLRLVVVSNSNGTVGRLLEDVGLAEHFACVIDSTLVGVEKPDPRIFRIALERAGARAESTVHVGDLYEVDVVGARSAGLEAILVDPEGLYADRECRRVSSIAALAEALTGSSAARTSAPRETPEAR